MTVQVYMLDVLMEGKVVGNVSCRSVVIIEEKKFNESDGQFFENVGESLNFANC